MFPIHEKAARRDSTIRNYLRVTLCNIHDELTKRADAPALAGCSAGGALIPSYARLD
jgi:hypothetical protein